ncbi:hypothetical protein A3F66_06140 [candidate division TM6 bacterium RIFCSPHIGHO2_12_FULL_32_22]|nr:MAG: hypothetical protein A3F66_06140 [candidate division TM6 bacterium RIFCSPHIGHO2_12_FULL_32_22]
MKSGFTLIELIIAFTISTMIAAGLFLSFSQVQKSTKIIEKMLSIDAPIFTFSNQFEKDISGAFEPKFWFPKEEEKQEQKESPKKVEEENNKKPAPPAKKEEYQKIEKVFFSANQNKNLKELTFITANPLQSYDNYKPRIARVLYKLVPDENNKDAFKLTRKESLNLDYAKINDKNIPEYDLISNIKSFSITYIYPEQPKEEKKNPEKKPEEKKTEEPKEVKMLTAEAWEYKEKDKEKEGEGLPIIPQFILVRITIWDLYQEEETSFEIRYQILAFEEKKEEEKPKPAPKPAPKAEEAEKDKSNTKPSEAQKAGKQPAVPGFRRGGGSKLGGLIR